MKAGGKQAVVQSSGRSGSHCRGLTASSTEDTLRGRRKETSVLPSFSLQITFLCLPLAERSGKSVGKTL